MYFTIDQLNDFSNNLVFTNIHLISDSAFTSWIHKNPNYELRDTMYYEVTHDWLKANFELYFNQTNKHEYFVYDHAYAITTLVLAYIKAKRVNQFNKQKYHDLNKGIDLIIDTINKSQITWIDVQAIDDRNPNDFYDYSQTVLNAALINSISNYRYTVGTAYGRLKPKDCDTTKVKQIIDELTPLIDVADFLKSVA